MKFTSIVTVTLLICNLSNAQIDTISEGFNSICDQMATPGRTYNIAYTGMNDIEWNIKTLYSSSSWWGGLDVDGNRVEGMIHCGSLQWDESNSGFAKATIFSGISTLSFQMVYGFQLVGGYVKVMIDGIEIGRTDPLVDKEVHTFTFPVNTPGPVDLELIPVVTSDMPGGIIVDNIMIRTSDLTKPFFNVSKLEDFNSWMDTLRIPSKMINLFVYAEHCLEVDGVFVDYFDPVDDVNLTVGSVIDLIPGDSTNIYYWVSVQPGIAAPGGKSSIEVSLPVNKSSKSFNYDTSTGKDTLNGVLSFINGNVDLDLIVFKLSDLKNEYRISYTFDTYKPASTDSTFTGLENRKIQNPNPAVKFYPNPVQNHAFFKTIKELDNFEIFDINGRLIFNKRNPEKTIDGLYRIDLEYLDKGIWIIRFNYMDNTMDAVKVMVQ